MIPSSPSSGHCTEKTNDPRSYSCIASAAEEKTHDEEENGTWLERKHVLIRKIEEIEAKHHEEKLAKVQSKKEAKHRREAAAQHQAKIQTKIEELCSKQAEFQRQIEEIQRKQAEIQRQRECLMDDLKLHGHKEQTNCEREQQIGRQYELNLEQIQSQADNLRRKLEHHDKQHRMIMQIEEKSAQEVFFFKFPSLCIFLSHIL